MRAGDYPDALPFVADATLWWGKAAGTLAGTWVKLRDTASMAAALIAGSLAQGWTAEQLLPWSRPFPQLARLTRSGATRVVIAQGQQVILTDYDSTTSAVHRDVNRESAGQ